MKVAGRSIREIAQDQAVARNTLHQYLIHSETMRPREPIAAGRVAYARDELAMATGPTHPLYQAVTRAPWRPPGSWFSGTPSRRRRHPRPTPPLREGSGRPVARPAHREYLCEIPVWRGQDGLLRAVPGVWPRLLVAPLAGLADLTPLGRRQIAALCGSGPHEPGQRALAGRKNCLWRAQQSPGRALPGRVYIQQQALISDNTSPAAQGLRQARFLIQFPSHRSAITKAKRSTKC